MNTKTIAASIMSCTLSFTLLYACGGGGGGSGGGTTFGNIQSSAISDIGNDVIVPAYADMATQFSDLRQASDQFCVDRNQTNLDSVRLAWRESMRAWSFIQAVELGRVGDSLRIRIIQTFPEAGTPLSSQVDAILAGNEDLTPEFFNSGSTQTRGLPAIEYL